MNTTYYPNVHSKVKEQWSYYCCTVHSNSRVFTMITMWSDTFYNVQNQLQKVPILFYFQFPPMHYHDHSEGYTDTKDQSHTQSLSSVCTRINTITWINIIIKTYVILSGIGNIIFRLSCLSLFCFLL